MKLSGKVVILGIFGVALAGAVATIWFQYNARRRSREFWGPDNALAIGRAATVELCRLKPPAVEKADDAKQISIGGIQFDLVEAKDISKAKGLVHVRDALIRDSAFDWDKQRGECQAEWQYVFRFLGDEATVHVALDTHCRRLKLLPDGDDVSISPMYRGLKELIDREMNPGE